MKNKIFILLFLVSSIVFSQEKHEKLKKQFRIAGDNAGIEASYEFPIAKEFTLDIGIGIGFGYYVYDNNPAVLKTSLLFQRLSPFTV